MTELHDWESFYVIVGSAAGALIGLQFVVLTLIAERPPAHAVDATAAFATPTIVHFSAVLLVSAVVCAPWHTLAPVAGLWGSVAAAGIVYTVIVAFRMRRQAAYKPGFEDWCFHAVLPVVAYAILAGAALAARAQEREALFGVGATTLLLLFIGVHNAWDAVVYNTLVRQQDAKTRGR